MNTDDTPAFTELRNFPAKDESIDIAAEVGTDYELFGTLLLEDKSGSKVKTIDKGKRGDAVDITAEILRLWLQGKGKQPVTWQTLIECLQDMKLNVLASNIKSGLIPKGDSDQPPSGKLALHNGKQTYSSLFTYKVHGEGGTRSHVLLFCVMYCKVLLPLFSMGED